MRTTTLIDTDQIKRHISYDPKGYVFFWEDNVYRAIYPESKEFVTSLWDCGLIKELIDLGLFPNSELTQYHTTDCPLVVSHEKIDIITSPPEWSFSMLKEAALTTIRVNKIARKYGYQTLDAHGFNISFCRGKAIFIDLGSLIKIENEFNCNKFGWRPFGEFMRSFYAPLKMWSKGESYFSRHSLYGDQLPMTSYWRYRSKLARLIKLRYLQLFELVWYKYKAINTAPVDEFIRVASVSSSREKLGELILKFSKRWGLPFSSVNLDQLENKITRIKPPKIPSAWSDYHKDNKIDDRQHFVLDVIKKYKPESVLDIAGNAGFFSKAISKVSGVKYVICADYDVNAIDQLFHSLKESDQNIYPVVMNFSMSIGDTKFPTINARLKSDMVLSLALTHHLILTQKLTIDFIMNRLCQFTNKYVAVEFMPMGLYSSMFNKMPNIPKWYCLDWFRQGFTRRFTLLEEKEIGTNRVILIGEVKR